MVRPTELSLLPSDGDRRAAEDHPHFLESATKLAAALRHTIFVDQVRAVTPIYWTKMGFITR